jgi:pyruvate/2-oxoglutarate dehydrogenase complex dihydrolipoamide dehydrogenase (E3) component
MSVWNWHRPIAGFCSTVTIIEAGPQLAAREDSDIGAAIFEMLRDEGITVRRETKVVGVQGRSGDDVSVELRTPAGDQTIAGSDILVAAGRTPNTHGIGLDLAGVALYARGYIAVNDRLETSAPMSGQSASVRAAHSSLMCRAAI